MKKAYLRIDDFPYSGELYAHFGSFRDDWMYGRFMRLVQVCRGFDVIPEIMVSSHAFLKDGQTVRFDAVVPKTLRAMVDCHQRGLININAHGMVHLEAGPYLRDGSIEAREFLSLDEDETRKHLLENIKFIKEVFGKTPRGFVAPAWGYNQGVTKRIAAEYFLYIADSYDHWKQGECLDFGRIDPEYGFIHFPETWRYGAYSEETSIVGFWRKMFMSSTTVHLMQHGLRIPGKWKQAITINPRKAISHLWNGNLRGIFTAARSLGVKWETLENEALQIKRNAAAE